MYYFRVKVLFIEISSLTFLPQEKGYVIAGTCNSIGNGGNDVLLIIVKPSLNVALTIQVPSDVANSISVLVSIADNTSKRFIPRFSVNYTLPSGASYPSSFSPFQGKPLLNGPTTVILDSNAYKSCLHSEQSHT